MYLADYHFHSDISLDARDSLNEILCVAIEKNINELCVTDHIEINDGDFSFHDERLARGYNKFLEAKEKFGDKIKLKFGIEIGQGAYNESLYKRIISAYPFDFVLCSLHRSQDREDYYDMDYSNVTANEIMDGYLEQLKDYALRLDYDCMAHLDIPLRYLRRNNLPFKTQDYIDRFEKIIYDIVRKGKGIEINTSGLREKLFYTMPCSEIINLYAKLGGEIITIGSDSHSKKFVGSNFSDAIEILKNAGLKYYCTFTNRKPHFIKI